MKIERKHLLGVAVACVFASGILSLVSNLQADPTTITFVVLAGTQVSPATDLVVFVGGKTGTTFVVDCAPDEQPVQTAVVVDPGGSGASRITGVIVTSQTNPVAPGTRLKNLVSNGTCHFGEYDKYTGEVQ